jgi:ribose transport system ATP-binding protein
MPASNPGGDPPPVPRLRVHPDVVADGEPMLRIARLSKTFPGTVALRDVSLDVRRGEIHALLGGNGSGKSTLVKILAGVHQGDPGGSVTVRDHVVAADHTSAEWARSVGVRFVHQNPAVFDALTVAENIAIGTGFETTRFGSIRRRELRRRTRALLERYDIPTTPETLVRSLRPADRTMVAIIRALQDIEGAQPGTLVLDEPTASLPGPEVLRLLLTLNRCAERGQAVLFVSHRLEDVVGFADRATVLRDGQVAGTLTGDDITEDRLIELIVGRRLDRVFPEIPERRDEQVILETRRLAGGPLRDASFELRRGEVLGVAGLLGSGRSELLKMLFGAYPIRSGEILLDAEPVRFHDIGDALRAGVAYVPEERATEAAFLELSLRENVSAAVVDSYWRRLWLHHRQEVTDARHIVERFLIRASSDEQRMSTLSGGNQQKVILARWLRLNPRILLLDEPTQGVDVNARAEIYALIRAAVRDGCSVLWVTGDFEELSHVCDRVIVIARGAVVGELARPDIEPTRLTELSYGTREVAL